MCDSAMIDDFQAYLRIDTRQPAPRYEEAIVFLRGICERLEADDIVVKEYVAGKPVLMATFRGTNIDKQSILLNSHMDVVPTVKDNWTHDPMSAALIEGKIYARGSQDMKCVGMAYLHAIQKLKSSGIVLKRTVHVCFVPDEEIGGQDGMGRLVKDPFFDTLHVEMALDEGLPSPFPDYLLFKQERSKLWLQLIVPGPAGHGSALMQGTAAEKLTEILVAINDLRKDQLRRLVTEQGRLGNVTSINVTMISSDSTQVNVIPSKYVVDLDVRIGPDFGSSDAFIGHLKQSISQPAPDCMIEAKLVMDTLKDISSNDKLENALEDLFPIRTEIFPGGTDARYLRTKGLPAFGISLFKGVPTLLHDHDEFMSVEAYLQGVENYYRLLERLCC
jgi:aminoacylase